MSLVATHVVDLSTAGRSTLAKVAGKWQRRAEILDEWERSHRVGLAITVPRRPCASQITIATRGCPADPSTFIVEYFWLYILLFFLVNLMQ
jgi:hypothetical protein